MICLLGIYQRKTVQKVTAGFWISIKATLTNDEGEKILLCFL